MTNQLSDRYKKSIYSALSEINGDYEFYKLLSQFVDIYLNDTSWINTNNKKLTSSKISFAMNGFRRFLSIIDELSIRPNNERKRNIFSWKSYCRCVNSINELNRKRNPRVNNSIILYIRKLLKDLYKYIINNAIVETDEIKELREHIQLLDVNEKHNSARREIDWPEHIYSKVWTNFPLNSNLDELYIYKYDAPKSAGNKKIYTTLNLKDTNKALRELLIEFIESYPKEKGKNIKPSLIQYRQFIYHFGASLYTDFHMHEQSNSIDLGRLIKCFNFELFNRQYRFYKMIDSKYYLLAPRKNDMSRYKAQTHTDILKEFYIFLLNIIKEKGIEHNPFQGTGINSKILRSRYFKDDYESGYLFVYRSGFEKIPSRDRWSIISNNNLATSAVSNLKRFDFTTIIEPVFKQYLKEFIWFEKNVSTNHLYSQFINIREFLNLKVEYDSDNANVITLESPSHIFSEDYILLYRTEIIARHSDYVDSIWKAFSAVKKFLNFISKDYDVPFGLYNYLTLKHRPNKISGNPIPQKDLALIKQGIRELNNDEHEVLYHVIFNLKATTHLRIGEILNLERNCISSISGTGDTGEIKYYSKTFGNKKKSSVLTIDKIRLIKRAIELTSKLREQSTDTDKKFIFIVKSKRLNNDDTNIRRISSQHVSNRFKQILENKNITNRYRVNHLRHTFKDTIWKEGISKGISTLKLEYMTDSKFSTDVQNYRAKSSAKLYSELFSGVSIADVNIKGEIVSEEAIKMLNPVEDGVGACRHDSCVKLKTVRETMYKCLTCDNFVTTLSRKEKFKTKIEELKVKRDKAVLIDEKEYIESEIRLYTAYYSSLIDMINNGGKDDEFQHSTE